MGASDRCVYRRVSCACAHRPVDHDASLKAWLSAVLKDSNGKRHEVLRRVIPSSVFDEVFADNVQFLQDQCVYSAEFFAFVKALLAGVEVRVCIHLAVHADVCNSRCLGARRCLARPGCVQ